jgi:hypothetical protein
MVGRVYHRRGCYRRDSNLRRGFALGGDKVSAVPRINIRLAAELAGVSGAGGSYAGMVGWASRGLCACVDSISLLLVSKLS